MTSKDDVYFSSLIIGAVVFFTLTVAVCGQMRSERQLTCLTSLTGINISAAELKHLCGSL